MPPLSLFDNYDQCIREEPTENSTYCITDVLIMPDKNSTTWDIIEVS